jgi:hypothetical protein
VVISYFVVLRHQLSSIHSDIIERSNHGFQGVKLYDFSPLGFLFVYFPTVEKIHNRNKPTNQRAAKHQNQPTQPKRAKQHSTSQPTSPPRSLLPSPPQTHHWLFGFHQLNDPQPKLVNVR